MHEIVETTYHVWLDHPVSWTFRVETRTLSVVQRPRATKSGLGTSSLQSNQMFMCTTQSEPCPAAELPVDRIVVSQF